MGGGGVGGGGGGGRGGGAGGGGGGWGGEGGGEGGGGGGRGGGGEGWGGGGGGGGVCSEGGDCWVGACGTFRVVSLMLGWRCPVRGCGLLLFGGGLGLVWEGWWRVLFMLVAVCVLGFFFVIAVICLWFFGCPFVRGT
uniref:Uncharacterized protein n=1 Tax=Knipowitschia caucasica TaxID=637954 RepID=A0AAV2K0V7_KNICA